MTEEVADYSNEAYKRQLDMIGPVCEKKELHPDFQGETGLVVITIEGEEYCPMSQFDFDSKGYAALRPELSAAWAASRALDEQLQEDALVTLTRFNTPRPHLQGRTWWNALTEGDIEVDGPIVVREILDDVTHRASQSGVKLRDPRTTLPEA